MIMAKFFQLKVGLQFQYPGEYGDVIMNMNPAELSDFTSVFITAADIVNARALREPKSFEYESAAKTLNDVSSGFVAYSDYKNSLAVENNRIEIPAGFSLLESKEPMTILFPFKPVQQIPTDVIVFTKEEIYALGSALELARSLSAQLVDVTSEQTLINLTNSFSNFIQSWEEYLKPSVTEEISK